MRTALLLAALAVAPACGTSNAQVPTTDRDSAVQLVLDDLEQLAAQPDATHWRRAYRHFDRHLEPHLPASERLKMEVAFGNLRHDLKIAPPDELRAAIVAIQATLQPQD
ncbi:MAG: hypothetical protein H6734_06250 [Alphaproteobacteria bacterium]|nr:hypothetical protein [Alphaproteobacteria bacterium]